MEKSSAELSELLARAMAQLYYKPDVFVLLDTIIKHKHISEKRLEEVIPYDINRLRVALGVLVYDKILDMDVVTEERNGQMYRDNYFFVNYANLAPVFKNKLEYVRKSLETLEKVLTIEKYVCTSTSCNKEWSGNIADSEAGEIIDPNTMTLWCNLCHNPMTEALTDIPDETRLKIAKFKKFTKFIYDSVSFMEARIECLKIKELN